MAVLRPLRQDLIAKIGCPNNLIGGVLDLFAFKEIDAILITRKIDNVIFPISESSGDREKNGVTETAAGEKDGFIFRYLSRRSRWSHHQDLFALFEQRAKPRRRAHFKNY